MVALSSKAPDVFCELRLHVYLRKQYSGYPLPRSSKYCYGQVHSRQYSGVDKIHSQHSKDFFCLISKHVLEESHALAVSCDPLLCGKLADDLPACR
jgi:hypothetical protein